MAATPSRSQADCIDVDKTRMGKTMNMKKIGYTSILFLGILASSLLHAGTQQFDQSMGPVVEAYLKIQEALADDKTDGVKLSAEKVAALSDNLDPGTVSGEHAAHYKDLPVKIKTAALKLAKGKKIGSMRKAFKDLSRPIAMWATMSKPERIYVLYCPMAKASWLQTDENIRNPYYGHKMLRCGKIVGGQPQDDGPQHQLKGH
jgi:Cu(I)/Ag(I) efflux system membrane fusion protein